MEKSTENIEETTKKAVRKRIIGARQLLSKDEVEEKSALICDAIRKMDCFKNAGTVMAYLPFRNEVDTTPLFFDLWAAGKNILVPVCRPADAALIPCQIRGMEDLEPGTWGILEPKADCRRPVAVDEIDMVIVPGVAFDSDGNRLGYGGGYYDRFIPRLKPGTPTVAVAFQIQIVPRLIPEKYDRLMDWVITEETCFHRR